MRSSVPPGGYRPDVWGKDTSVRGCWGALRLLAGTYMHLVESWYLLKHPVGTKLNIKNTILNKTTC